MSDKKDQTEEKAEDQVEEQTEDQVEEQATDEQGEAAAETSADETSAEEVSVPEFATTQDRRVTLVDANMDRLHGVKVPVWVELGRVEMLIGEMLRLGEGSVVRLDRSVGDPVDLVSQGVKLARGEVVVVDDSFAIRIREVLSGE